MSGPEPILQVRRLSKHFGGLAAVDNVSLEVSVGVLQAVIGPNGAGKTTLINMLSGDLPVDTGNVLFRGSEIAPLPPERINLVGADTLTGAKAAAVWSQVLGRTIAYPGDDTAAFEKNLRQFMPSWMAFDMRLMSERFLSEGMIPDAGDVKRLTALLGRPLRSYRDFVAEIAAAA